MDCPLGTPDPLHMRVYLPEYLLAIPVLLMSMRGSKISIIAADMSAFAFLKPVLMISNPVPWLL